MSGWREHRPVFRGCKRGCNRWIVSKWWLRWMQSRLLPYTPNSPYFQCFLQFLYTVSL